MVSADHKSMAYQKVSHRKTRTGCVLCKKRRIKCDEAKPSCRNCLRYPSKCSFSSPFAAVKVEGTRPDEVLLHLEPLEAENRSLSSTIFTFADFELLHHWTVKTANSMATSPGLQKAMRELVPEVALKHDGLMHAMFAMSALHIAHLNPEKSKTYLDRAAFHHALALPVIRSNLANITESNCHAIYASGHLLLKYAFGRPEELDSLVFTSPGGMINEWVALVRGAITIHDSCLQWLSIGAWRDALETLVLPLPEFTVNPQDHHYAALLPLFDRMDNKVDAQACREALNQLRKSLSLAYDHKQTISTKTLTYYWPAQVPQRFVEMVAERKPHAIIVLGHYCVMLKMIEGFWYMKNCASRLLKQVKIHLGEDWVKHIEWPMEVVGL